MLHSLKVDTGHIRSPTLNRRGEGLWGCLQMMTMTPVMSSNSSIFTVVSTGSPENTWLGHWARIRLRVDSRRTERVKVEENRLDPEDKDVRILGHTLPQAAHLRKGHDISKTPSQLPKTQNPNLSCQFQNMTKEKSHCSPSREAHP